MYVPNNPAILNAAYSGFIGGINNARSSPDPNQVQEATEFAQAVDAGIPPDPDMNQSKSDLMGFIASNCVALRSNSNTNTEVLVILIYNDTVPGLATSSVTPGSIVKVGLNYWIDPVNGKDTNNGTSPITAFATWAQLQKTFGYMTTIVPVIPPPNNVGGVSGGPAESVAIADVIAGPGGAIQIVLSAPFSPLLKTGDTVQVGFDTVSSLGAGVTGTLEANGNWTITVIDDLNFTLNGSQFVNAYTGGGYVATPVQSIITINILNNLPPSDPITFYNFLGLSFVTAGVAIVVKGQANVLRSGTLTGVQNGVDATNTPSTITDTLAGDVWGPDIYLHPVFVTCSDGTISRAIPSNDLGAGQVQVTEWCSSSQSNFPLGNYIPGFTFYGTLPVIGNSYDVVDYTQAYPGVMLVGYDTAFGAGGEFGATVNASGYFVLQDLHLVSVAGLFQPAQVNPINEQGPIIAYCDVIFDEVSPIFTCNAGQTVVTNCSMVSSTSVVGTGFETLIIFGLIANSVAAGAGGLVVQAGGLLVTDGRVQSQSSVALDAPLSIGSDQFPGGSAFMVAGPMSWWNFNGYLIMIEDGSEYLSYYISLVFFEEGYNPMFGSNPAPTSGIYLGNRSCMYFTQITDVSADIALPTVATGFGVQFDANNIGLQINGFPFSFTANTNTAWAFDPTVGQWVSPTTGAIGAPAAFTSFALLGTPVGAGGFAQPELPIIPPGVIPGFHQISQAGNPSQFNSVVFDVTLTPGP